MSTYKSGLLLIDSSLDNIHNIVKNLKYNIYYIFIDNYDTDIIIKQMNMFQFDFVGVLFSNELLNPILNQIENEINLLFDKIDSNNYNKYFNFEFNYNQTSININYNNEITLSDPNITFLGGIFSINSIINSQIDKNTGIITIIANKIGNYELSISYTFANITISKIINVISKPNVKYFNNNIIIYYNDNYISELPIIENIGGLFTTDNENIIIDQLTGQFKNNNLLVNTYKFNIKYTLNDVSTLIEFILMIKPKIVYNNYSIQYLKNFISDKPFTNPDGGRFLCQIDNVIIDNHTGIVQMNNLKVNNYDILINYYYNNTYTNTNLILTVYPILNYIYPNNGLLHNIDNNNLSFIPIMNPIGGTFLINNNDITINENGIIDFTNFHLIGQYDVIVKYIYNNISTEFIYKFSKSPVISLNSYYEFIYGTNINIALNNIGLFQVNDNNFIINDFYLMNNNVINVGTYDIDIKYTYNNVMVNKPITIIIKPEIQYDNNEIIINNNDIFISNIPIIKPNNGSLTCSNNIVINQNGQISIDPLKYYEINNFIVYYKVNDIIIDYYFTLIINPYFKYNDVNITLPNKITYYSDIPIVNRKDGIFSISNNYDNLISINNNGQLCINKELTFGDYDFDVIYKVNNLIYTENFNVIIKPTISYPSSQIIVTYGKYYESEPININTNYISTFNINDTIDGITINPDNGILKINNGYNISIGKYLINVSYNIVTSTVITIIITPELIYNSVMNTISYGTNYQSQKPFINPNYGDFKLITNNNNIIIDETGIINANDLDIGIYNLTIQYICNDIIKEISYSIICNSIINYPNSILEINYGKGSFSDIPYYLPSNGTFKLKENMIGISIKNNGILEFDPTIFIGNYNIEVIYQIYNNIVTTNYNLTVKPNVIYNDTTFIYYITMF